MFESFLFYAFSIVLIGAAAGVVFSRNPVHAVMFLVLAFFQSACLWLLAEAEFLAGNYSIADMACFPWMRNHRRFGVDIEDYPNIGRWLDVISARPAVQRGLSSS